MTERLVADGTDSDRLRRLVQFALEQFSFDMLYLLDEPTGMSWDDDFQDVGPFDTRRRLMETHSEDASLTSREVGGLHESWQGFDGFS